MYGVLYRDEMYCDPIKDCVFFDDLEEAQKFADAIKKDPEIYDVKVMSYSIRDIHDANEEILRLRNLLSQSYLELQRMKEDYNGFIKRQC